MSTIRDDYPELRTFAEQRLQVLTPDPALLPGTTLELIHELQVHQIELEMQNEALRDAQSETERAIAKYRALYELSPIACLSLGPDARIAEANQAAATLLGSSTSLLLGQHLSKFIAQEHAETFELHRREVLASRAYSCSCLLELVARGTRREVRVESVKVDAHPSARWLLALVDVTEINLLQRRAQQAQKLETLGTLTSGIAHDFGNLLHVALSCAESALTRLTAEHPAYGPIAQLREVAIRGRLDIAQLLRFSRPGESALEMVHLDRVLEAAARLLSQLLGADVQVELALGAGSACILADRGQLDQILFNLASNARHAMPSGGRLRIATRVQASNAPPAAGNAAHPARHWVALEVTDTGLGMDEETRARAFEPFFTTKRPSAGTGLGLSMVFGAVSQAGGQVELHSTPGHGTTVSLYWPLHEAGTDETSARRSSRPARTHSAVRSLVVDDDRLARSAVRRYLEASGCEVLEAKSGEAALELLEQDPDAFQLLVTDVVLAGMQGKKLAAAAQGLRPGLAVLFVSGYEARDLVQRGWIDPDARLLHKPFNADQLQDAIREVLGTASSEAKHLGLDVH